MSKPVLSGQWSENHHRYLYLETIIPDESLCTAVFGLPLYNNNIILTEHKKRGRELPGGHKEPGELLEQTLIREIYEETGYTVETYNICGYIHIVAQEPTYNQEGNLIYPFPDSYIPYYICTVSLSSDINLSKEIQSSGSFSIHQLPPLRQNIADIIDILYTIKR